MKRLLVFGSFVLLLMVATPTWAEGQDNHGSHRGSPTPAQHQNMQHTPTMDEPAAQGGHGHGGPVVEIPPNWGVLSAFAAINLLFILIGIRNKWTVRKAGA